MVEYFINYRNSNHSMEEIYKGFSNFSIFIIPIDFSYDSLLEKGENLNEIYFSISENSLNHLNDELINTISKYFQEKEQNICECKYYYNTKTSPNEIQNISSLKTNNNSLNEISFINEEENKEDKNSKSPNSLIDLGQINSLENSMLSFIQNYSINIYNPSLNYVNICCPTSSISEVDNNNINEDNSLKLNEKEILSGKLSPNIFSNSGDINKSVNNISSKNNKNFIVKNSLNDFGDKFPRNFSHLDLENNIFFNNEIDRILNAIENNNNINENNINSKEMLIKKTKKKKKKKVNDEYTFKMFGRRGWICEDCNNFNYESRKFCNRCKIPKKPLKKDVVLDNKKSNIMQNINHKDDWNCYNCGNVNFAFRLNCNRCQMKRENFSNVPEDVKAELVKLSKSLGFV